MFSSLQRAAISGRLQSGSFDLAVIGGGVTGAGIALDAASRGLKVALIEKNDFASGTSGKSTKLIHGGLRYLKQLEIGLVQEVGRERAIVHRNAPHLVRPEKMLLPLIKGGTYGRLATSLGLRVYDLLAGVSGADRRVMLDKKRTQRLEPLLREDILLGGGYYAEYRTDDARLTLELIKTAAKHGAVCMNYVQAEDFLYDSSGQVHGVHCLDLESGNRFDISSRFVVSATGPWVDQLRRINHSLDGKQLFLSKGVHIVVPHRRFPVRQAVYFDVSDGRMVFAIPRQRVTYIGTTDTPYTGNPDRIAIELSDVEYLLEAANDMFPGAGLSTADVESGWAGLRPLIFEEGKSASQMSRRDEIFESASGLLSIAGGKLTGYRKMAERIVNRIAAKMKQKEGRKVPRSRSASIPLCGGPFSGAAEVTEYQQQLAAAIQAKGLDPLWADYLTANYGRQSDLILDRMAMFPGEDPEITLARAEAWYTIHQEMALTLVDFFNRRTGRMYFYLPGISKVSGAVTAVFAETLAWDEARINQEKRDLEEAIRQITIPVWKSEV